MYHCLVPAFAFIVMTTQILWAVLKLLVFCGTIGQIRAVPAECFSLLEPPAVPVHVCLDTRYFTLMDPAFEERVVELYNNPVPDLPAIIIKSAKSNMLFRSDANGAGSALASNKGTDILLRSVANGGQQVAANKVGTMQSFSSRLHNQLFETPKRKQAMKGVTGDLENNDGSNLGGRLEDNVRAQGLLTRQTYPDVYGREELDPQQYGDDRSVLDTFGGPQTSRAENVDDYINRRSGLAHFKMARSDVRPKLIKTLRQMYKKSLNSEGLDPQINNDDTSMENIVEPPTAATNRGTDYGEAPRMKQDRAFRGKRARSDTGPEHKKSLRQVYEESINSEGLDPQFNDNDRSTVMENVGGPPTATGNRGTDYGEAPMMKHGRAINIIKARSDLGPELMKSLRQVYEDSLNSEGLDPQFNGNDRSTVLDNFGLPITVTNNPVKNDAKTRMMEHTRAMKMIEARSDPGPNLIKSLRQVYKDSLNSNEKPPTATGNRGTDNGVAPMMKHGRAINNIRARNDLGPELMKSLRQMYEGSLNSKGLDPQFNSNDRSTLLRNVGIHIPVTGNPVKNNEITRMMEHTRAIKMIEARSDPGPDLMKSLRQVYEDSLNSEGLDPQFNPVINDDEALMMEHSRAVKMMEARRVAELEAEKSLKQRMFRNVLNRAQLGKSMQFGNGAMRQVPLRSTILSLNNQRAEVPESKLLTDLGAQARNALVRMAQRSEEIPQDRGRLISSARFANRNDVVNPVGTDLLSNKNRGVDVVMPVWSLFAPPQKVLISMTKNKSRSRV